MKLLEKPLHLTLSGIDKAEINYAKIVPTAAMMDILGNKLYKNKIQSTVRETLSNAKDASIKAGVTTPIEVHIPTLLEPWFSIKDYGVGMSEETIVNVYFNYGMSTKQDSNEEIGGFGIGAKVAGVYSGQFNVTSVKDGFKSVYQFFKNEKGFPCNTPLYTGTCDEPNGTEIKISANEAKDFDTFLKETAFYAKWLGYPVTCNKPLDVTQPEYFHKQKEFGVTKTTSSINGSSATIIVGGIPYSLDSDSCGLDRYSRDFGGVNYYCMIIFANIGDVDLIASREELEYTDKTLNYIKEVKNKVAQWYASYKKDKTLFWLLLNKGHWESEWRSHVNYGFNILCKPGKTWDVTYQAKAYTKYISLESFEPKRAWLDTIKRSGGTVENTAFILKKDIPALIKLGADKSSIVDFDDIPKGKRGKLAKYKVAFVDGEGRLKYKRVNDLDPKLTVYHTNVEATKPYQIKDAIIYLLQKFGKEIAIVCDNEKECELKTLAKLKYPERKAIRYCYASEALARAGIIKKKNEEKKHDGDEIRSAFSLIKGELVDITKSFPLINNNYRYEIMTKKMKEHIKFYTEYVLKENPEALKSDYIEVLDE